MEITPKQTPEMSVADWQKLAALAKAAEEALNAFELAVLLKFADLKKGEEQQALIKVADRLKDNPLLGMSYLLTPQSQWMGGETWKIKQPHIVGTFTQFIT